MVYKTLVSTGTARVLWDWLYGSKLNEDDAAIAREGAKLDEGCHYMCVTDIQNKI